MPVRATASLIAAILFAPFAPGIVAHAQPASGPEAPMAQAQTAAAPPGGAAPARKRARRASGPQMDVSSNRSPTGPYTSTVQPDTSDLSGSEGASVALPQGVAPPGVTPPNGSAPDTGGGAAVDDAPNAQGGPHPM